MGDTVNIQAEQTEGGFWVCLKRSAGQLPETPLHSLLTWIIEQLNFGHYRSVTDSNGDVVSVTIGREAPLQADSIDGALEHAQRRMMAVSLNRLFAKSRESGIEPQYTELSKLVTRESGEWGRRNTEFHYAFELTRVLARLNKKTFGLEAPPVRGIAPSSVISYLAESTKCWLYGFHGASVALSRACLEEALKARLPESDRGTLEVLIDSASRRRLFDDVGTKVANTVRSTANRFLHGENITEAESRETLEATRGLVEQLFS